MGKSKISIRINCIDFYGSVSDGPGVRMILYVQGCLRRCMGCHNSQTWDITGGSLYNVEDLVELIVQYSPIRRITISGGEPLLQLESVGYLIELLKKEQFDIALYTGEELEDVPVNLLKNLNYIKTGAFVLRERCTTIPYIGSKNQCFIDLKRENYEK